MTAPAPNAALSLAAQHPFSVTLGIAGVVLMLAAIAWRIRWAPRLLAAAALYSRLSKARVAGNGTRQRIAAAIDAQPGVETALLEESLQLNGGTLEYHLRVLERENVVKSLRVGRTRTWFTAGAREPEERERALREPARRLLREFVAANPGATLAQIAQTCALAKSTAHEHLQMLASAGILEARRSGLRPRYFLTMSERSLEISSAYSPSSSMGVSR